MRGLVQRVSSASVSIAGGPVGGEVVGEIGPGLCVLIGVTHSDTSDTAEAMAEKLWNLRLFDDADGVMNLSAATLELPILIVSQFTLYADTRKGRRPSYLEAAKPEAAEPLIEALVKALRTRGAQVQTGRFRADMAVSLVNDGPITLTVEIEQKP